MEIDDNPEVEIKPLKKDLATKYVRELVELAGLIPQVSYSEEDILAESKPDGRVEKNKWEHSYLATKNGEIVGFLMGYERAAEKNEMYPTDSLYMSELAVRPDQRGQGIAKDLIKRYLSDGKQKGIENYTLQTNSADWNRPVIYLYEQFGFKEGGHKQYDNRRDVIMRADPQSIKVDDHN